MRWSTRPAARYFLAMLDSLFAFVAVSAIVICTPGQGAAYRVYLGAQSLRRL